MLSSGSPAVAARVDRDRKRHEPVADLLRRWRAELTDAGFPPAPFHLRDKLPPVVRFAGHRPLTWIGDTLTPEARAWAAKRRIPTLLIATDPAEGLTRPVIDQSLQWADDRSAK